MALDLTRLTFASLGELDGTLEALLQKHLAGIANDCINRPEDSTARKVVIEFAFVPKFNAQTRDCDDVDTTVEVKSKVPVYRTPSYRLRVNRSGFAFNADFPDAPDQQSLFPKGGPSES